MTFAASFLAEFEHEAATTRTLLAVAPPAKFAWSPHVRSMTLGRLVVHLASNPGWIPGIIQEPSFDTAPGGVEMKEPDLTTTEAVLATFDACVAQASAAISDLADSTLGDSWSLLANGQVLLTMPRAAVLRTFGISHLIHHRGQLCVYLRLLDVKLPSVYGPTADGV